MNWIRGTHSDSNSNEDLNFQTPPSGDEAFVESFKVLKKHQIAEIHGHEVYDVCLALAYFQSLESRLGNATVSINPKDLKIKSGLRDKSEQEFLKILKKCTDTRLLRYTAGGPSTDEWDFEFIPPEDLEPRIRKHNEKKNAALKELAKAANKTKELEDQIKKLENLNKDLINSQYELQEEVRKTTEQKDEAVKALRETGQEKWELAEIREILLAALKSKCTDLDLKNTSTAQLTTIMRDTFYNVIDDALKLSFQDPENPFSIHNSSMLKQFVGDSILLKYRMHIMDMFTEARNLQMTLKGSYICDKRDHSRSYGEIVNQLTEQLIEHFGKFAEAS